jgi:dienelactone hydrolase
MNAPSRCLALSAPIAVSILLAAECRADDWPSLPETDATVTLPAQEWPHQPGPRTITAQIHYPGGKLANVGPKTGLMLTLHNWGGENCAGTANPRQLAQRLNVVALCVNYLQSGRKASIDDPEPYDFGYLQSLDALRSLWFVHHGLKEAKHPFAEGRVFCTGGSGGGNVTLMANKLAPRTFACIVDMCGMKKLSHDIAFHFPGGSDLDARWSRDPKSANYLSVDAQELRFVGHPGHLATMKSLGHAGREIIVHGSEDTTCPFADAVEMVALMKEAKLDVTPWFLKKPDLDGKVFTSTGHGLGDRTEIVFRVAGDLLSPDGPKSIAREGASDFDLRDEKVRYKTSNGAYVISYKDRYPVGRFEADPAPVAYDAPGEHQDLTHYRDRAGTRHPVKTPADWELRRGHIREGLERVMGKLPGPMSRVPLDVKVVEEKKLGAIVRRKVTYQTDADDRVSAWLFLPESSARSPAILCLQQTTNSGKDEPAGLAGDPNLHYALHLAERGYVVLAPDYPSFGEHKYDFAPEHGYVSGSMKAIWDNVRSVDYLVSLPEVDAERIGCLGHSLGGHNAMFTAVFEPRIKVIVSSCGFCRFHKDDVPSWTGPRYMPRIASVFGNSADKVPFDFPEIIGSFAPRPFLASAAKKDNDFDVAGVQETMAMAKPAYQAFGAADRLEAYYPEGPHGFPADAREVAYTFLDRHLKR